jgi:hypothetical protein
VQPFLCLYQSITSSNHSPLCFFSRLCAHFHCFDCRTLYWHLDRSRYTRRHISHKYSSMHRYRIVTQVSLIFSILNLVLAAPVGVPETPHEAVVAEDVPATPNNPGELETAPGGSTSPPPSPDAMASPQHSSLSGSSTSSGYPAPYLSSDESVSGYSWMLHRLPRLSLLPPESSSDVATSSRIGAIASSSQHPGAALASPATGTHSSEDFGPSVSSLTLSDPVSDPVPSSYYSQSSRISSSTSYYSPSPHSSSPSSPGTPPPALLQELSSPSTSSEIDVPEWLPALLLSLERSPVPWPMPGSALATAETPPERFTPLRGPSSLTVTNPSLEQASPSHEWASHQPSSFWSPEIPPWSAERWALAVASFPARDPVSEHSSDSMTTPLEPASGGLLSSHYHSASDESLSSHYFSASDGSPPSSPENAKFLSESMMKKLKIAAGLTLIGGVIGGIAAGIKGSRNKHKHRDFQDS